MWAAHRFLLDLESLGETERVERVMVELYGSLALTGKGHATDVAILLGLMGERPDQVNPDSVSGKIAALRESGRLLLGGTRDIAFDEPRDLLFRYEELLPEHSNGMRFSAFDGEGNSLRTDVYYSVGGGFVMSDAEFGGDSRFADGTNISLPYPFESAEDLLKIGDQEKLSIAEIVLANERAMRSETEVRSGIQEIWQAMSDCIARGCREEGVLPGGLNVRRRAKQLHDCLKAKSSDDKRDPLMAMDWVSLYALAVNEENAIGPSCRAPMTRISRPSW
jgi:L-serine dehydratase